MVKDYDKLTVTYKWHDKYNKLPLIWKCPFCQHIQHIVEKTKNVPIKCDGIQCDAVLTLV